MIYRRLTLIEKVGGNKQQLSPFSVAAAEIRRQKPRSPIGLNSSDDETPSFSLIPNDIDELKAVFPGQIEKKSRQLGSLRIVDDEIEIAWDAIRELPCIADHAEGNPVRLEHVEQSLREVDAPIWCAHRRSHAEKLVTTRGSAQLSRRRTHQTMTSVVVT